MFVSVSEALSLDAIKMQCRRAQEVRTKSPLPPQKTSSRLITLLVVNLGPPLPQDAVPNGGFEGSVVAGGGVGSGDVVVGGGQLLAVG